MRYFIVFYNFAYITPQFVFTIVNSNSFPSMKELRETISKEQALQEEAINITGITEIAEADLSGFIGYELNKDVPEAVADVQSKVNEIISRNALG